MGQQTLTLTIESIAYGGAGIARHDGMVYFVEHALPGECILAQIIEKKKRFARARAIEITHPSAERIEPACPYYTTCGGCTYQHCSYAYQCTAKKQQVIDAFERISKIETPPVANVVPCTTPFHFRNRITLHKRKPSGNTLGFFSGDNETIIQIDACLLAHDEINDTVAFLQNNASHVPFGDIIITRDDTHIGILTSKIRSTPDTHMLAMAPKQSLPTSFADLVFSPVSLADHTQRHLWSYDAHTFRYAPYTFFQTNPDALNTLCSHLRTHYTPIGSTCIDAYCGVGLFALLLADQYTTVIGIEENPNAITLASVNAQHNEIEHIQLFAERTEKQLPLALKKAKGSADVILDPPRSGLSDRVISTLLKFTPKQITYLSCEPTTAARDIEKLADTYAIESIVPFDMFPQTKHVELLITLKTQ